MLDEEEQAKIKDYMARFRKLESEYNLRHEFWINDLDTGKMKDWLTKDSYYQAKEFYSIAKKELFPALLDNNKERAKEIVNNDLMPRYEKHRAVIDKLVVVAREKNIEYEKKAENVIRSRVLYLILIGLGIVFLVCLFSIVIIRGILVQLGGDPVEVLAIAREIANGNLSVNFDNKRKKTGIYAAMHDMSEKLKSIISSIVNAADTIAVAGQQVNAAIQQISEGANEQVSSVENITAAIGQFAASTKQNNESAFHTDKITTEASFSIKQSNNVVANSNDSMKEIASKITIIGDIAFQTNILALNAAVEAARAGEHGRGFAVVASEVRKLAERSRIAADEINVLSKTGVEMAENAVKQFENIVPEIDKAKNLVQEISSASHEQSSGIEQINTSIQSLNLVTQHTAVASEEMARNVAELASQAVGLKDILAYFNVHETM